MSKCHKCGHILNVEVDFGRQELCPGCRAPTRCCLNCSHYDATRYNECTEPVADRVVDKEKGNFCDYFKPGGPTGPPAEDARSKALKAAEALFKKKT